MKKGFGKKISILLIAAMSLMLSSCGSKAVNTQSNQGSGQSQIADQIVIGKTSDAAYLDPNQPVGVGEVPIMQAIYEGLVATSADGKSIAPCLATDWKISSDELVYTFNLRPNLKFSDGTPVTGEDWKWSLLRARDSKTSNYTFAAAPIKDVESDGKTVTITLKEPSASFLGNLSLFNMVVGSEEHYNKVGEQGYSSQPLGTGPYMLKEWQKEKFITLEKNPYYWQDGLPVTKEIKFTVVSDDNTRSLQLQSGGIDIMPDVPFSAVSQIKANKNAKLYTFPSSQIRYLILNTTIKPFDNEKVRQAMEMAVDKNELAAIVCQGYGQPAESALSSTEGKWFNSNLQVRKYDPQAAKSLLAEAGFPNGLTFTLSVSSQSEVTQQIATMLKSELAKAGITVNIELLEKASLSAKYQSLKEQATLLTWIDDFPDPEELTSWAVDYSQSNAWYTGLDDKALGELNAQARLELNEQKRVQMYHDIQQKIYDNANIIPLFSNEFVWATTDKVKNLAVSPFYVIDVKNLQKTK